MDSEPEASQSAQSRTAAALCAPCLTPSGLTCIARDSPLSTGGSAAYPIASSAQATGPAASQAPPVQSGDAIVSADITFDADMSAAAEPLAGDSEVSAPHLFSAASGSVSSLGSDTSDTAVSADAFQAAQAADGGHNSALWALLSHAVVFGPHKLLFDGAEIASGSAKEAAGAVAGFAGEALEAGAAAAAAAAALAACGGRHVGHSAAHVQVWVLACKHHLRDGAQAAAHAAVPPLVHATKAVVRWFKGARLLA